jgi:hypothetical protein
MGEEAVRQPSSAWAGTELLKLPSTSRPISERCSDLGIIPYPLSMSSSNLMRVSSKGKAVKRREFVNNGIRGASLMRDRIGRMYKALLPKHIRGINALASRLVRQTE